MTFTSAGFDLGWVLPVERLTELQGTLLHNFRSRSPSSIYKPTTNPPLELAPYLHVINEPGISLCAWRRVVQYLL